MIVTGAPWSSRSVSGLPPLTDSRSEFAHSRSAKVTARSLRDTSTQLIRSGWSLRALSSAYERNFTLSRNPLPTFQPTSMLLRAPPPPWPSRLPTRFSSRITTLVLPASEELASPPSSKGKTRIQARSLVTSVTGLRERSVSMAATWVRYTTSVADESAAGRTRSADAACSIMPPTFTLRPRSISWITHVARSRVTSRCIRSRKSGISTSLSTVSSNANARPTETAGDSRAACDTPPACAAVDSFSLAMR